MPTARSRELFNSIAVGFLERCEADASSSRNCPAYIREWILREQNRKPNK